MSGFIKVGGALVETDALRIAERINDYDPDLKLQYLERAASIGDPPFRIVGKQKDGTEYVVLTAWQLDQRVLDRLYAIDNTRQDLEKIIEETNRKAREAEQKKQAEVNEEAANIASAALNSPKSVYTAKSPDTGEKVKLGRHDDGYSLD